MVSQDALINAVKKSATVMNEEDGKEIVNTGFTNLQLDNW